MNFNDLKIMSKCIPTQKVTKGHIPHGQEVGDGKVKDNLVGYENYKNHQKSSGYPYIHLFCLFETGSGVSWFSFLKKNGKVHVMKSTNWKNSLKRGDIDVTFPCCVCLARYAPHPSTHQTRVPILFIVLRVDQMGCLPSPAKLTFLYERIEISTTGQ